MDLDATTEMSGALKLFRRLTEGKNTYRFWKSKYRFTFLQKFKFHHLYCIASGIYFSRILIHYVIGWEVIL